MKKSILGGLVGLLLSFIVSSVAFAIAGDEPESSYSQAPEHERAGLDRFMGQIHNTIRYEGASHVAPFYDDAVNFILQTPAGGPTRRVLLREMAHFAQQTAVNRPEQLLVLTALEGRDGEISRNALSELENSGRYAAASILDLVGDSSVGNLEMDEKIMRAFQPQILNFSQHPDELINGLKVIPRELTDEPLDVLKQNASILKTAQLLIRISNTSDSATKAALRHGLILTLLQWQSYMPSGNDIRIELQGPHVTVSLQQLNEAMALRVLMKEAQFPHTREEAQILAAFTKTNPWVESFFHSSAYSGLISKIPEPALLAIALEPGISDKVWVAALRELKVSTEVREAGTEAIRTSLTYRRDELNKKCEVHLDLTLPAQDLRKKQM